MRQIVALWLSLLTVVSQAAKVDLLVYQVQEPGVDSYISRILVSRRYMRLDEGDASGGSYTVFDRQLKKLFNVDPLEETVLEMTPPDFQPVPPDDMRLEVRESTDPGAPPVAGQRPSYVDLQVNGKSCRNLMVIKSVLPDAVAALGELYRALARLQYPNLGMPGYTQNDCENSEYVYAPQRAWEHGLPILDVMEGGKRRLLVDFKAGFAVEESIFAVPDDYQRVTPSAWK